jgi:hypothetical protein
MGELLESTVGEFLDGVGWTESPMLLETPPNFI